MGKRSLIVTIITCHWRKLMQNEKIDLIQCENNSSYTAALHVQLFPPWGGGNSGLVLVACVCRGRAAGVQANWTRLIMQNLTLLTAADVTRRTLNSIGIWNCLLSLFAVGCMTSNSTIKVWQCCITSLDIKPISWDIITNNEWWRWRGDLHILTENLINSRLPFTHKGLKTIRGALLWVITQSDDNDALH